MHEIYPLIGAAIRERREAVGMTQAALAEKARLARTSVTNIERGGQALLLHQLVELAAALGVSPASLLPDTKVVVRSKEAAKPVTGKMKALIERLERPSSGSRST